MRKKIFNLVEPPTTEGQTRDIYDAVLFLITIISLIPLAFKDQNSALKAIDAGCTAVFILDYFLRWITADFRQHKGAMSFLIHPFTPIAITDLIAILPGITSLNRSLRLFKFVRLFRAMRVFRIFKAAKYSKNISIILKVFRNQRDSLLVVCALAFGYIIVSALIMFNVEPDTFETFFDALYWATVSLTTVGYGDIYATSTIGKAITRLSAVFGTAIVALPAGIITAGYMEEINKNK